MAGILNGERGRELNPPGKKSGAGTIILVSPGTAEANNGNWHTAQRWSRFLSGHCDTDIVLAWPSATTETGAAHQPKAAAMIALHARRSAASMQAWAAADANKPLILVLTGTDLYRDIHHDAAARRSLQLASTLVVLQAAGIDALPAEFRAKARVIYQSAPALRPAVKPVNRFTALMVGHLRAEKDPLTWLRAAALPCASHVRFELIGAALDPALGQAARQCEIETPRFRWLGARPRPQTRQRIKRAHLLVNCSQMEGGAHVILEAVQSGTPVLASRISGNLGMLGSDYDGYFDVGDAAQLAALVRRCACDAAFLQRLRAQCAARARLFDPCEEKRLVLNLVVSALQATDAASDRTVPKA